MRAGAYRWLTVWLAIAALVSGCGSATDQPSEAPGPTQAAGSPQLTPSDAPLASALQAPTPAPVRDGGETPSVVQPEPLDTETPGQAPTSPDVTRTEVAPGPALVPPRPPADLPLLSAFGTPSVDGVLSPGEWDGSAQLTFLADPPRVSGEGRVPVTILVQNDDWNLYFAAQIGRLTDASGVHVTFDNDDDGVAIETGDDIILGDRGLQPLTLFDASWYPCEAPPGGTPWCLAPDVASVDGLPAPGTADGAIGYSVPSETQVFEFSHPLRSGDRRDIDLAPGRSVGIQIVVQLGEQRSEAICADGACGGGANAWARIARAASDTAALVPGPSVTLTELGPAAVNGWHRAPTKVRVRVVGDVGAPAVPTRTWAAPAVGSLGGSQLRVSGNAVRTIIGDGATFVHAFALDAKGRSGPWASLPVRIDSAPPTVTAPRIVFREGGVVGGRPVSTVVSWFGTDAASGVDQYQLQEAVAGGPYRTIAAGGSDLTSVGRRLKLGTVYRYRVRATDVAGNVGRWVEGMPYRVFLVDSTSDRIKLAGSWTTAPDSGAIGGSVLSTTQAGSTVRLEFLGSAIAVIAPSGAGLGVASVSLDGGALAGPRRVDLAGPALEARVANRAEWSGNGRHVIEVRTEGTPGRPRVDLDAFLIVTPVWSPNAAAGGQLVLTYEAEHLAATGDVTHSPSVRIMSPWGRGLWSNNRQLEWASSIGETLRLNVPVTPGRWLVRAYLTQSDAGGVVRVTCESCQGREIDLHGQGPVATGAILLDTMASSWSTTMAVAFTLVGPGKPDVQAAIGIDRLELEPAN